MPETTENAPETKTETCPKKGCKDCGCWVCIAPYLMAGIIFLACWWIFFYLSCGGASNTQDTILLAATVFGSGLAAALIAVILALPCYLIIHNRNQTELKKMKWELKYKSKKE